MRNKIGIRIVRSQICDSLDMYFVERDDSGEITHVAKPVDFIMEPIPDDGIISGPTFRIGRRDSDILMQDMANELARNGVSPDATQKVMGQLEATKNHLEDMRTLVFDKLDELLEKNKGDER